MKALLRKDLYANGKNGLLMVGLALLFSCIPAFGTLGNTYAVLLAFMVPLTSIAADEKSRWDRLAAMLPYRVEQLVWSKYLLSYLYTLAGGTIMLAGAAVRGFLEPEAANWDSVIETVLMMLLVMLLMTSIGLPLMFRFGSETGRLVTILLMAVGIAIFMSVFTVFNHPGLALFRPAVVCGTAAAAVGAAYLSSRLSIRFYRKRRNGTIENVRQAQ